MSEGGVRRVRIFGVIASYYFENKTFVLKNLKLKFDFTIFGVIATYYFENRTFLLKLKFSFITAI